MAEVKNDTNGYERVTVRRLIEELQKLPPDAVIAYVDFDGYSDIDSYVNEYGEVEIGPK